MKANTNMKACFVKEVGSNKPGDILDIEDELAEALIKSGHAVEVPEDTDKGDDNEAHEEENDGDEPAMKSAAKVAEKKAKEVASEVEKQLKKIAERKSKAEPGANTVRVLSEEKPHRCFGEWLQDQVRWREGGDEIARKRLEQAARYGRKSPAGASSTGSTSGLELVPRYWADSVYTRPVSGFDLFSLFTQFPMEGKQVENIPVNAAYNPATQGCISYYTAEASAYTLSTLKTNNVQLSLNAQITASAATDQVLRFSPYAVENMIVEEMRRATLFKRNSKCVRGSGSGEPLGILSSTALVTVTKESGQSNSTINWTNILKMLSRRAEGFDEWVFLANWDTLPALYSITDANNNALYLPTGKGADANLFPSVAHAMSGTLYGIPVVFSQHASQLGDFGDLILVAPKSMVAGFGGEFADESIHVLYSTNEKVLRLVQYNDTKSLWLSPFTPEKGANTLSPQIALGARGGSSVPMWLDGGNEDTPAYLKQV